jgi:hypothetical protein
MIPGRCEEFMKNQRYYDEGVLKILFNLIISETQRKGAFKP